MSEITAPILMPAGLHTRRPDVVHHHILNGFKIAQATNLDDYTMVGRERDYAFPFGIWGEPQPDWIALNSSISATEMLGQLSSEHKRRQRVLDIGAGFGGFVINCEQQGHLAHGLTAMDFRRFSLHPSFTQELSEENYIIGNGDNLMDIPELLDEYDLIVSQYTFMHMADPLGAVEQAIQKVAPQGVIAVNKLMVPLARFECDPEQTRELMKEVVMRAMVKVGFVFQTFQTHFEYGRKYVSNTFVAKASAEQQPFCLPLDYTQKGAGAWGYCLAD